MLATGVLVLQFLVGGVFLVAAAAKLLHLSEFKAAVRGFGLVPARALQPVSGAIPLLELLCGTLLITGFAVTWGVWLGIGLVVVSSLPPQPSPWHRAGAVSIAIALARAANPSARPPLSNSLSSWRFSQFLRPHPRPVQSACWILKQEQK